MLPTSSSLGNLSGSYQSDYNHLEGGNGGISPIENLKNNPGIESSSNYEGRTWSLISTISQIGKFIGNTLYSCLISPFVIVACKIYEITKKILNSFNDDSENSVETKATPLISPEPKSCDSEVTSAIQLIQPPSSKEEIKIAESDLVEGFALNSSSSTTEHLPLNSTAIVFELDQEDIPPNPITPPLVINSEVVQLSNEASQIIENPRITIKIPAQGNCLFCAIFAGLKLVQVS